MAPPSPSPRRPPHRGGRLLTLLLVAGGCHAVPPDPTLVVEGDGGVEAGVSTTHGVVFLGRTVEGGEVSFTAFFYDGPSREVGIVEPLGGGIFTTESPIVLPVVPICFDPPLPGDELTVMTRFGTQLEEFEVEVGHHPAIEGLCLIANDDLRELGPAQIGSGVYVGGARERELVGLISGRVRLETADGAREYFTVVGADDLWRLAAYQREVTRKRRWVYREDVL